MTSWPQMPPFSWHTLNFQMLLERICMDTSVIKYKYEILFTFQRLLLGAIYSQRMDEMQHLKSCIIKNDSILLKKKILETSRKTHSLAFLWNIHKKFFTVFFLASGSSLCLRGIPCAITEWGIGTFPPKFYLIAYQHMTKDIIYV